MKETYIKNVEMIENQIKLAKIGYREEVLKLAQLMSKTSSKESDMLLNQINDYANAIMKLEEDLSDAKRLLNREIEYEKQKREGKNNDNNK